MPRLKKTDIVTAQKTMHDLRKWMGGGGFQPTTTTTTDEATEEKTDASATPQAPASPPRAAASPVAPRKTPMKLPKTPVKASPVKRDREEVVLDDEDDDADSKTTSTQPKAVPPSAPEPKTPSRVQTKKAPATTTPKKAAPAPKASSAEKKRTRDDADGSTTPARTNSAYRGPRDNTAAAPGSKNIPWGGPANALEGFTFIVTGRLEALSREEAQDLIKSHGGQIRTGVTKKLSYMVAGEGAGESKTETAAKLGTKVLTEDELYELIRQKSAAAGAVVVIGGSDEQRSSSPAAPPKFEKASEVLAKINKPAAAVVDDEAEVEVIQCVEEPLWCDKYRPKTVADMCYSVAASKLTSWLEDYQNKKPEVKKAALLSGPPGTGKTTAVQVVSSAFGYDLIEFNASDTRSALTLRDSLSSTVTNQSIVATKKNILVLMDEVDGCDRGGVAELIKIIKKAKVPIVCTCNDRFHQKLRSFVNHCEDIRVARAPSNHMTTYITRLLHKEGVSIPATALQDIISMSGNDYRSVLNNAQMWVRCQKAFDYTNAKKLASTLSRKDEDVGMFQSAETFFLNPNPTPSQLRVAFYSNDLMPLFVQENYIHYRPEGVPMAAHLIAMGDVLQRKIMGEQRWDLSNAHCHLSSVYPTYVTRGGSGYNSFLPPGPAQHFDRSRPVKFPSWLGRYSTSNKYKNAVFCMTQDAGPLRRAGGVATVMDYFPVLRHKITNSLASSADKAVAVRSTIDVLDAYRLRREDWDIMNEVVLNGVGGKELDASTRTHSSATLSSQIPAPLKAALTREFNKTHATMSVARSVRRAKDDTGIPDDDEDDAGSDKEKDGDGKPTKPAAKKGGKTQSQSSSSAPSSKKPRAKKAT